MRRIRKNTSHIFKTKWRKKVRAYRGKLENVYAIRPTEHTVFLLKETAYYKSAKLGHQCPTSIYKYEKNIKDIDLQSNFLQNSKSENQEEVSTAKIINFPTRIKKRLPNQRRKPTNSETKAKVIRLNKYPRQYNVPKTLAEHYPLNQEDCAQLQSKSGREFTLNAINEILLDMSKRLERQFKSKARFIAYFSKCLMYEMRDAVKISNENFKINANQSTEEIEAKQQEEYLAEIEYNLQVSPEWRFKKKIAAILDRTKAYDFLKNYRSSALEEGVFKIYLDKNIELSKMDRAIILQQVKATHERFDLSTTEFQTIETIEIIMPEKKSIPEQIEKTNNRLDDRQLQVTPALTGIWGNVRKILISYYGEKGSALDRSWFSKLTAIEDAAVKILTLTSPTRFICCYIQEHYQYLIKQFCEEEGYRLEIC